MSRRTSRSTFLAALKSRLSPSLWPVVLPALRHLTPVWEAALAAGDDLLALPQAAQAITWSPAGLALFQLGHLDLLEPLRRDAAYPLPDELHTRALSAWQQMTDTPATAAPDLPIAALLALALRERQRVTGGWRNLPDDLHPPSPTCWRLPLACLAGLVPDPEALLAALATAPLEADLPALLTDVVLAQPWEAGSMVAAFRAALDGLPLPRRIGLLECLESQRPDLAAALAHTLEASAATDEESLTYAALLARLAGDTEHTPDLLKRARRAARRREASLLHHLAQQAAAEDDWRTALSAWEQAARLAPDNPLYALRQVEALLHLGEVTQAARLLTDLPESGWQAAARALVAAHHHDTDALQEAIAVAASLPLEDVPADLLLRLAQQAVRVADYATCARFAAELTRRDPRHPEAWRLLCRARAQTHDLPGALEAAHFALALDPDDADMQRQLALMLEAQHDFAQALELWQTLAAREPSPETWHGVARCALRLGDPHTAQEAARAWLAQHPGQAQGHVLLGQALLQLERFAEAVEHFQQATLLQPDDPHIWLAAAQARRLHGDRNGALDTLRAAAIAIPQEAAIHLALGEAWLDTGQPTQALTALDAARCLLERLPQPDPKHARRYALLRAQALTRLGRHAEAERTLTPLWQAHPNDLEVAAAYAHIALAADAPRKALQALQPHIQRPDAPSSVLVDYARAALACRADPQAVISLLDRVLAQPDPPPEALGWKAEALRQAGQPSQAVDWYRQALKHQAALPETQARLWRGLGLGLLDTDRPDEAIPALEKAAELEPHHLDTLYALVEAHRRLGSPAAWEWLQRARQAAPSDTDNLCRFAEAAQALQRPDAAVRALRRAADLSPQRPDVWLRLAAASPEHALEAARRVTVLPTASPADLEAAARLLLEQGAPQEAQSALQHALDAEPTAERWRLLAQAHQMQNDLQAALDALTHARQAAPRRADLALEQADVLESLERPRAAAACLEEALPLHPRPALVHARLSDLFLRLGDLHAALEHARARLSLEDSLPARLALAELACALLRDDEAAAALHPLPEGESELRTRALCLLAECHLSAAAEVAAAEALTQAQSLAPDHPHLLALTTRLQLRQGNPEAAAATWERLTHTVPALPFVRLGLAIAAREMGDWEHAVEHLRALTQQYPAWPRMALELARTLIERAEARALAGELEVVRHTPSAPALAESAARAAEKAIVQAGRSLTRPDGQPPANVLRWYARAQAIFHPSPSHADALSRFADHPDDLGAHLLALRRAGQLAQAVPLAQAVLQQHQSRLPLMPPRLLLHLALTLRSDHPEEALALAERAAQHPQATPLEQAALALLAQQNQRREQAIAAWQAALHTWPDEPRWHTHLARLYLSRRPPRQDDLQQAARHLERALSPQGDDLPTRLLLAQVNLQLARPDRAIAVLQPLTDRYPQHAALWLTLARAHFAQGDLDAAHACAKRARSHHPAPSEEQAAALLLARIALQRGQPAQAVALMRQVQRTHPSPEGQLLLAQALEAQGKAQEALQTLESVFHPHTAPFEVALTHARLVEQLCDTDTARRTWQALVARFPDRLDALLPLIRLLAAQGENEQAIPLIRQALDIALASNAAPAQLVELHRLLGRLHARQGQLDLALDHLTTALNLNPEDVESYLALADVYEARREPALAVDVLQQARALRPDDAALHFRLGCLYRDLGELDAAAHLLYQASQLDRNALAYRHEWMKTISMQALQRAAAEKHP